MPPEIAVAVFHAGLGAQLAQQRVVEMGRRFKIVGAEHDVAEHGVVSPVVGVAACYVHQGRACVAQVMAVLYFDS